MEIASVSGFHSNDDSGFVLIHPVAVEIFVVYQPTHIALPRLTALGEIVPKQLQTGYFPSCNHATSLKVMKSKF